MAVPFKPFTYGRGFNSAVAMVISVSEQDAGPNATYAATVADVGATVNGGVGAAILLNPEADGQQVDTILASVDSPAFVAAPVETTGLRIAVVGMSGTLQALQGVLDQLPHTIGAKVDAPAGFSGSLVPDLSGAQPSLAVLIGLNGIVAAQTVRGNSLQVFADVIVREPGLVTLGSGVQTIGANQVNFSPRPGGGVVIPPGVAAAVLVIAYRSFTNLAAVGNSQGQVLRASCHGGPLAPGQWLHASAPQSQLGALGGSLAKDGTIIPGTA